MGQIYKTSAQLIGNTPLLELSHIEETFALDAKIYAKLEYFNPAGSVKDRIAAAMIEAAEKSGKLSKDSVILLEQIRTIDKRRLREHMGHLDEKQMTMVDNAIAVSFGLEDHLL